MCHPLFPKFGLTIKLDPHRHDCGFSVDYPNPADETIGQITVFFGTHTTKETKLLFYKYIYTQLEQLALAGTVKTEMIYQCSNVECGYHIPSDVIRRRRVFNASYVSCPVCESKYLLTDLEADTSAFDSQIEAIERGATAEQQRQRRATVLNERENNQQYDVFLCHNSKDRPLEPVINF